ncbi:RNA-binding protein 27 isoform X1, partial [Tachysurus ichikawai]
VINKPHTPGSYVLNKSYPKQQSTSGTVPAAGLDPLSPAPESSMALAPASTQQKGLYSRTVFKPAPKALGKAAKAFEDQDVLKKKQEALKLQQDMRKKKREMLEKQIEYQKVRLYMKITSDSAVRTSRGSSLHHPGGRTEKSLVVNLPLNLRDGGKSRAVL